MARKKRYQLQNGELTQQDERPSRSAKKRQATALQNLGKELLQLSPDSWSTMPDELREALRHYRSMKDHEARRRQEQYVGRLMRELDEETLLTISRLVTSIKNPGSSLDIPGGTA